MEDSKIEYYECEYCGYKFEVPYKERLITFVLHKPQEWSCPKCGHFVFAKDHRNFGGSSGGKF